MIAHRRLMPFDEFAKGMPVVLGDDPKDEIDVRVRHGAAQLGFFFCGLGIDEGRDEIT